MDGPPDARCAAIAAAQEGRVGRWQLVRAGISPNQIRWRLKQAVLTSEHHGVYAYGHPGETRHSTEIAALLTRGEEALICGHRAAGMYGFRPMCDGVDLLVPDTQGGGHRDGVRVHRSGDADRLAPRWLDGVPVVAPAHALLDIAADLSPRALEVALDEAFSTGRVNRDEVRRVLVARPTRPGVGILRQLLAQRLVGNPSGSPGQERLLALIRAAQLPDPVTDAPIGGGFSADAFWPGSRVAAEYDSFTWHSSRSSWARDRRKDRHCAEHGIELVRVTDEDLDRASLKLIATLSGLIARRG